MTLEKPKHTVLLVEFFAYLEGPLKGRAHKLSIETSKRKNPCQVRR